MSLSVVSLLRAQALCECLCLLCRCSELRRCVNVLSVVSLLGAQELCECLVCCVAAQSSGAV